MWNKPQYCKIFGDLSGRLSIWELSRLQSRHDKRRAICKVQCEYILYIIIRSPSQGNCCGLGGRSASRDKNAELQYRTKTRKVKETQLFLSEDIHQHSKEQEAMWLELQAPVLHTLRGTCILTALVSGQTHLIFAEGTWEMQGLVCPLLTGEGPAVKASTLKKQKSLCWL